MRALIQRVRHASVTVDGQVVGSCGKGLLILLGVGHDDDESVAAKLWNKARDLRIFDDEAGKTNLSLLDVGGEALVVSQFTLYANCRRGRRPSFAEAGKPTRANELYEHFCGALLRAGRGGPWRGARGTRRVWGDDGRRARERRAVHHLARYGRAVARGRTIPKVEGGGAVTHRPLKQLRVAKDSRSTGGCPSLLAEGRAPPRPYLLKAIANDSPCFGHEKGPDGAFDAIGALA